MKPVLWFVGTWWGSAFIYFVLSIVVGAVAGKSVSAGESAVMGLGCIGVLIFLGGTGVFWKMNAGTPNRTVLSIVHVVFQLGTLAVLGFFTMLMCNR